MTEERQLLKATIQGDTAAFELIVQKYQNLVCAITFGGTGRIEASEELAQETFFNAWRNIANLKDLERFRPWLCSIARNLVCNYHRERKSELSLSDAHIDVVDPDSNPSENAVSREETMILEKALNRIPAEYREPLVLFYRQGHSVRQVAEGLDLNESTVKTRLHRGRQMLKEQTAALVERTLERTVPDAQFTKTVMVGIGAGLAAGIAGTASVSAATVGTTATTGGSMLSTATGLLSTLVGKIVVTAAAVIAVAGVSIYTYQNTQKDNSQRATASETHSEVKDQSEITFQEQGVAGLVHSSKSEKTYFQTTSVNSETASTVGMTQDLSSSRHPDWPKLNEPVDYIYSKHQDGDEMWVHLPGRFREEDARKILIDNGKNRIEVNKTNKTVQYSDTLTAGETPFYKFEQPLIYNDLIILANLFRNSLANLAEKQAYTIEEIVQRDDASILVYDVYEEHMDSSKYDVKAYVDASTMLPEKIVVTNTDPNSETCGQIADAVFFDFVLIPDSIFEYTTKTGEALLTRKEAPCFRGTVVDTLNNPVPKADVFIHYFPLWGKDYLTGKTDSEGKFEIKIPSKPHEISINLPVFYWAVCPDGPDRVGWTVLLQESNFSFKEMNEVTIGYGGTVIQNNEPIETVKVVENDIETYRQQLGPFLKDPVIEDIQLVMEPAGIIAGVVTDKEGNTIPEAQLSADFQMGHSSFYSPNLNWKFTTVSDDNGHYEFHGLPALWGDCKYFVTFSAEGYVTEREFITLQESLDYLELDISLEQQLVTIRGILTDNYGTALDNREISVSAPKMSIRDCSARTDPNGCFVLEGCPDVEGLEVVSSLAMGSPEGYPVTTRERLDSFLFYPGISNKLIHVLGKKEYFVELTAIRPETTLEVFVTDSAGNPLPEFTVRVDGVMSNYNDWGGPQIPVWWRQIKLEKRADENGRIFFDNIPDMKEMSVCATPGMSITWELHTLNGIDEEKRKEGQRLNKIDEAYREKYQRMEIPVELIEGHTDYSVEVVVLTKEEAQSLPETNQ